MYRVTVYKKGRRYVAEGIADVNPASVGSVRTAANAVCEAKGKHLPAPALVVIEEKTGGGRWRRVGGEVVLDG